MEIRLFDNKYYGYGRWIILFFAITLLAFVLIYGERLNHWDGKTWDDFNQSASKL